MEALAFAAPGAKTKTYLRPAGAARSDGRRQRDWHVAAPHPQRDGLAREARIAPLLAQVLCNRGVFDAAGAQAFLHPNFANIYPPDDVPNAVAAAQRLAEAARAGRRVVIYGDYDVDGVTATTILWHVLTIAGADVHFHIPSRLEEGYGLNAEALERLAADGAQVVITVDCGITACAEAQRARELGLELIVTDHHQPRGGQLPDALLVHPTAGARCGQNADLSGAGVALKVAWAFAQQMSGTARVADAYRQALCDAAAFAAMGLVADVVPLTGENRLIASYGLKQLCKAQNPGLRALIEVSGLTGKSEYDDYDVGFLLAPRLNAVGRMGHARLAVEMFTRATEERAREIAQMLDSHNRQRQSVERQIVKEAEALVIERGLDRDGCCGIVLASRDWHAGVIGIVASRIVEKFGRPTILIALDDNGDAEAAMGQGSGRSVRHFPLHEALANCDAHLVSHGGHAMAAGVKISAAQLEPFTRAFQEEAARRLTPADLRPRLELDDEAPLDALAPDVARDLQRLAPFGPGNPRVRLAATDLELVHAPRVVGRNGSHLQMTVRQGRAYRKAIAFGWGSRAAELTGVGKMRVAFEPLLNEWNGTQRVELRVVDCCAQDGDAA